MQTAAFNHSSTSFISNLNCFYFISTLSISNHFSGYVHRFPSLTNSRDTREINDEFVEAQRTWKECDVCDMHIPLRTYHCSLCNACISIPDHRKEYKSCVKNRMQEYFYFSPFFQIVTSWVNVLGGPTKDFSYVSHFTPALVLS